MAVTGFLAPPPVVSARFHLRLGRGSHASRDTHRPQRRTRVNPVATREADPLTANPLGPPLVLCVGEALYDLFSPSPTAPISDRTLWTPSPGGAPANLAAGLAKLGTASALIGNVGDDTLGDGLLSVLKGCNVNIDGVQRVSGHPTREVFVRRDERGERAFVAFGGLNDQFADACALDPETLPGVLFYAAQVLVAPTLSLAFPGSAGSLRELVDLAKLCKLRIVVDVNWRPVFWDGMATEEEARDTILSFVRDADIVKLSVEEIAFLYDQELANEALERPGTVLKRIEGNATGVIVTAGANGAAYAFHSGMQPVTGRVKAVVPKLGVEDTTGAGDAFLAGFLSEMFKQGGPIALANAEKVNGIAEFASTVASFVVTAPGPIEPLPSRELVESTLKDRVA